MEAPQVSHVEYTNLPGHSDCPIAYTLGALEPSADTTCTTSDSQRNDSSPVVWLIFINGLGASQAFWQPTIQLLESDHTATATSPKAKIYTTTYDRYGQGLSRRSEPDWKPTAHDCNNAAGELGELIAFLRPRLSSSTSISPSIVLVGHSLGVPILRLFMQQQQHEPCDVDISGTILIDSNIANIDMTNLLPDPDHLVDKLPSDTSVEQLRQARANYTRFFAPSVPNGENLDRVSLLEHLPHSNRPVFSRRNGEKVALTVMAHDPEAFAEEGLKISTKGLTMGYIEPAWRAYNVGLLRLDGSPSSGNEDDDTEKIVVAKGAGHFVQKDNPRCLVDEIWKTISRL